MSETLKTVAILDHANRLIGIERVENTAGRLVVDDAIDLPLDGSYAFNWTFQTFVATAERLAAERQKRKREQRS